METPRSANLTDQGLYQPLPSQRAIRLLRFLPGPIPKCQMVTVEVEKAPPYVALSYTWGSKSRDERIEINGIPIPITRNLFEAISGTFESTRTEHALFWADSICINQADIQERGSQVRIMNTIYRSAEFVVVWLGLAEDGTKEVFDKMQNWHKTFEKHLRKHGTELALDKTAREDRQFFMVRSSRQMKLLRDFQDLFDRPWWRRAWIVQEATLHRPKRVIVCCGEHKVKWSGLRTALQLSHSVSAKQDFASITPIAQMYNFQLDEFQMSRQSGCFVSLTEALGRLRVFECEDPRDKVYAALGMAMDVHQDDIIPDYTSSFCDLYKEVVRFSINTSSHSRLDMLGYVLRSAPSTIFDGDEDPSLPTWVPDWRISSTVTPFKKTLIDGDFYRDPAYNADGSHPSTCLIEGNQLFVQGSYLDEVTHVSSVSERNLGEGWIDMEQSWMSDLPPEADFAGGRAAAIEAFNHTIMADIVRSDPSDWTVCHRGGAIDWKLCSTNNLSNQKARLQRWMSIDMKSSTFGRRFFLTKRGFMGLGPAATTLGDSVCVLFGGQVLYVLRENDELTHEFIGECYVHGMMDGQACDDESFSARQFVLV